MATTPSIDGSYSRRPADDNPTAHIVPCFHLKTIGVKSNHGVGDPVVVMIRGAGERIPVSPCLYSTSASHNELSTQNINYVRRSMGCSLRS